MYYVHTSRRENCLCLIFCVIILILSGQLFHHLLSSHINIQSFKFSVMFLSWYIIPWFLCIISKCSVSQNSYVACFLFIVVTLRYFYRKIVSNDHFFCEWKMSARARVLGWVFLFFGSCSVHGRHLVRFISFLFIVFFVLCSAAVKNHVCSSKIVCFVTCEYNLVSIIHTIVVIMYKLFPSF